MTSIPGTCFARSRSASQPSWLSAMILLMPCAWRSLTARRADAVGSLMETLGPGLERTAVCSPMSANTPNFAPARSIMTQGFTLPASAVSAPMLILALRRGTRPCRRTSPALRSPVELVLPEAQGVIFHIVHEPGVGGALEDSGIEGPGENVAGIE